MTLGRTPTQPDVFRSTVNFCQGRVSENSIYAVLHRKCHNLFPDEMFADLFTDIGRRSVPPMIVAVAMVLQRCEGLSDRETADRFAFDLRWKYAAGGLDFDFPGFVHTVLVDMRARLATSDRPERIFEVTLEVARKAGLVGRRQVVDSTPIYDALATMDTITLIRSAIRGLLRVADAELAARLQAVITSGDDYAGAAKPVIDWEDAAAREALIDSRAKDAFALLGLLEDCRLPDVVGQDVAPGEDGVLRITRKVARDRVISTVDPEARHGHKTRHRSFDGYKGHLAEDPDSEIITATAVTAGNSRDAEVAGALLADLLPRPANGEERAAAQPSVYGDSAYGAGELLAQLEDAEIDIKIKTQAPVAPGGRFTKDAFAIDLPAQTVTCPGDITVAIRASGHQRHAAVAVFGQACPSCPLAAQCTTSKTGRTITLSAYEAELARARARRAAPAWQADYKATRPKVERKIGHLMRRRHGGRRARVRGQAKVAADFSLLAAAVNLARLAVLGVVSAGQGNWQAATA
jgi:hypothetical protein